MNTFITGENLFRLHQAGVEFITGFTKIVRRMYPGIALTGGGIYGTALGIRLGDAELSTLGIGFGLLGIIAGSDQLREVVDIIRHVPLNPNFIEDTEDVAKSIFVSFGGPIEVDLSHLSIDPYVPKPDYSARALVTYW